MAERGGEIVWLNGALLHAEVARIDPSDRGLTLGDGLFETILVVDGKPRHIALHLARLRRGAAVLGIEVPLDDGEIGSAFAELLAANGLANGVLRLTLTRGAAPRGVLPPADIRATLLITAGPLANTPPDVAVIICRTTRRNAFSPLAAIKSLNYLDNIIARQEALLRGAEDAILLNTQGDVAEATTANLLLRKGENWLTPHCSDGALPGIFRARLIAANLVTESTITQAALFSADDICLCNALGLRSISAIDGREIAATPAAVAELRKILLADD